MASRKIKSNLESRVGITSKASPLMTSITCDNPASLIFSAAMSRCFSFMSIVVTTVLLSDFDPIALCDYDS